MNTSRQYFIEVKQLQQIQRAAYNGRSPYNAQHTTGEANTTRSLQRAKPIQRAAYNGEAHTTRSLQRAKPIQQPKNNPTSLKLRRTKQTTNNKPQTTNNKFPTFALNKYRHAKKNSPHIDRWSCDAQYRTRIERQWSYR
jgi:hypothetical protein